MENNMSDGGSVTSTSHLLATRFRQTSKKNKIIASALLTVALIGGSVGFIHMYHKSNSDLIRLPEVSENGQGVRSDTAFIRTSSEENVAPPQARTQDRAGAVTVSGSRYVRNSSHSPNSSTVQPSTTTTRSNGGQGRKQDVRSSGQTTSESPNSSTVQPCTTSTTTGSNGGRARKKGEKVLPDDAKDRHPVSLLYEMKLQPSFKYFECKDGNTTLGFKSELRVLRRTETEVFLAYGKNKRQAKRIAAEKACEAIWCFTYPYEDIPGLNEIMDSCAAPPPA